MTTQLDPIVIQGGMGVAISSYPLARAVAATGQLGVVSGTGLDVVLARRLQLGDPDGDVQWAMNEFPLPEMAARVLDRYFIHGGKHPNTPFRAVPLPCHKPNRDQLELLVVANFVEVFLAKHGHRGLVGINFLEKIQLPTLPSLYGAMLAGVDYVLMGAGIPRAIPGILDHLSQGEAAELILEVQGANAAHPFVTRFDPHDFCRGDVPRLKRPRFLAIVASVTLATMLTRKANGHVDGFVVEGPTAGGHNAPPRGRLQLNVRGEPIYGTRDAPDLQAFRALERPFWLAGSFGNPEQVVAAINAGAAGVQVGTAFAFCKESGLRSDLKREALERIRNKDASVFTSARASPTGFPFKVLDLPGTLSDGQCSAARKPVCDLGYLRRGFQRSDGTLGWRCPAEDVAAFVRKGGEVDDTQGRQCLCNALMANIGLEQVRGSGKSELPLVTCGDDVNQLARFLSASNTVDYSAATVVSQLLANLEPAESM